MSKDFVGAAIQALTMPLPALALMIGLALGMCQGPKQPQDVNSDQNEDSATTSTTDE